MSRHTDPQLMTVREVASTLNIGISSVWRHVRNGTLPAPLKICGSTRWRRADIDALIAAEAA